MIMGKPRIIGGRNIIKNLTIGPYAFINVDCFFDLAAPINIGQEVGIGPQTMLITGAHEIADEDKRVGALEPRAITIGDGVWLGARCIILPGVSVGHGAVVAAGAIVTKDVPANVLVAGVPARVIKELPSSGDRPFSSNDQNVLWVEDNVQLSLNAVSLNEFPNRD